MNKHEAIKSMVGRTFTSVTAGDVRLSFTSEDGKTFCFTHYDSCCESVEIEDIVGDLSDLVGSPLVLAEEVSSEPDPGPKGEYDESYTWTFYRFATVKGTVTVRWYGTSNGYYSESVDLTVDGKWFFE